MTSRSPFELGTKARGLGGLEHAEIRRDEPPLLQAEVELGKRTEAPLQVFLSDQAGVDQAGRGAHVVEKAVDHLTRHQGNVRPAERREGTG